MTDEIQQLQEQCRLIKQENDQQRLELEEKRKLLESSRAESKQKESLLKELATLTQQLDRLKAEVEEKLDQMEDLENLQLFDTELTEKAVAKQLKEKDDTIASIQQELTEKQQEFERLTSV
ncbi:hypothetical protein BY458DRAFT_557530 [Sporodiniella umbellata]|nr:hypothetical protein BY458DRAFT_557530 [Sporodiniella umbellata]